MEDHPHPAPAGGGPGHNGWQMGQVVVLQRGSLAGVRGLLVRHNGHHRWIVSVDCLQRGVFLTVPAEDLVLQEPAAEMRSSAESTLPPLRTEGPGNEME